MKSINDIFKNNRMALDIPEVNELVEYCRELEGKIIERKQNDKWSMEDKLAELARDVYNGMVDAEEANLLHDRWPSEFQPTDYKEAFNNLKKYFEEFAEDNKFRL